MNDALTRLVELVNYRWTLPLVAELHASRGAKLVTLSRRLGASRESLRRSLAALIEQGLVRRNPGYGHPMRPEYILTDAGRAIGLASEKLVGTARDLDVEDLAFRKWSLPVVHNLDSGLTRFRGIQVAMPPVTSRALSLTLKSLQTVGLATRSVTDDYPPVSSYELTARGARLASPLAQLRLSLSS